MRFASYQRPDVFGRLEPQGFGRIAGPALLLSFLLLVPFVGVRAQTMSGSDTAERLQQLVAAEQSALDSVDAPQILISGKQLGSLALRLLGGLYTSQGKCAAASDVYQQSLTVDDSPESLPQRVQTGLLLLASDLCAGRPDAAKRAAEQIVRIAGDTSQVHLLISNAWHGGGDLPSTIAELSRAVALEPLLGPAHLALGDAFWELNEYQYNPDTLREFSTAQRLNPKDSFANQDLGFILSQYERYDEASTYLGLAATADPASPDPWLQLGMNAFAQDHPSEARSLLKKAVVLTGSDEARNGYQVRRAYAVLSRIEANDGREAEAAQFAQLEEALHAKMLQSAVSMPLSESTGTVANHAPKDARPALASLGTTSKDAPNLQQQELEQRLHVIVAKSLNDAGTVLARNRDYAAALPLFRIASIASPELQPVMRNFGLAAFHTGGYEEAVGALARALEQTPEDPVVRNDLDQSRAMLTRAPGSPKL